MYRRITFTLLIAYCLAVSLTNSVEAAQKAPVSFSKQVAPILVQRCRGCHRTGKAEGGFRLDSIETLLRESDSGRAVVPGKPDDSELLRLIASDDDVERMPKDADALTAEQIALIRRWIGEGTKFDGADKKADLLSLLPQIVHPDPPKAYRVPVPVLAIAFSPNGKELAVGGYFEVTIWDAQNGRLLRRIKNIAQRTQGLEYNAAGSLLAVGGGVPGELGELRLFDPATGKLARRIAASADILLDVAFSPDGKRVATAGSDRSLRVYETATGRELARVKQFADWVTSIDFNRDGTSVAASSRDHMIKVFDPQNGSLQSTYVGHKDKVFAVTFNPDSNDALTAGEDSRIHVWDPKVIAAQDGTAAQMEARFKKNLAARHIGGFGEDVLDLVVSGGHVYSASADGTIRQNELKSGNLVRLYAGTTDWVYALAVHPQSKRLAAGSFDGTVRIWEIENGKPLLSFTAAPGLSQKRLQAD